MWNGLLYLANILEAIEAIEAIERFTLGHDERRFLADDLIQSAVLQKLSIIGEAAARLSDKTRTQAPDISWKEIIGFRNIAAHACFSVDWRIVFVTVTDELPSLKKSIVVQLEQSKSMLLAQGKPGQLIP